MIALRYFSIVKHHTRLFIGGCLIILAFCSLMIGAGKGQRFIAKMILSSKYNHAVDRRLGWVVPGADGWLFYLDDLRYLLQQWSRKNNEKAIERFVAWLTMYQIKLVMIPVPTPLEVYPEKLMGFSVPVTLPATHEVHQKFAKKRGYGN